MDGNSDSQASQILANLKDRREASKLSSASESLNSNVTCTESSSSLRNAVPTPRYHLHGLATTQTQTETQLNETSDQQGSQKENVHSPRPSTVSRTGNASVLSTNISRDTHPRPPVSNFTKPKLKGNVSPFKSPSRSKVNGLQPYSHCATRSQYSCFWVSGRLSCTGCQHK
ncbi:hypothetical protein K435DRAFT_782067 [Dendrothele bispora CBS 962.96]|uniref:Uncharacterized protein n=1 Tax=Dendrothele bispora (strain CBS 962.96) TaxID=1314807 RepID=A0A4S8LHE0_DENBC|nr:hypothetical protein K435DRAFT_782067 [Dendrothele bispora CBS 962.96]